MEKEMVDFIDGKLRQCRDRLVKLLLQSSNSKVVDFARAWREIGIAPPALDRLLFLSIGRGRETNEPLSKIYLAVLTFQEANECFDNDQALLALDKLFAFETLMVELELTPLLIKSLGKRGGKKKQENRLKDKVASRRYYRENNLVQLTDRAAGKVLFSQFPIELRTAESYAAEYKRLTRATDELIDEFSRILAIPAHLGTGGDISFSSPEVKREALEKYLAGLKDIMGEGFDTISPVEYPDIESYLAALRVKMLDEGGL